VLGLKTPCLGVKMGGNVNFVVFFTLGMQYPGNDALQIKLCKNWLSGFGSRREQNFWSQNKEN